MKKLSSRPHSGVRGETVLTVGKLQQKGSSSLLNSVSNSPRSSISESEGSRNELEKDGSVTIIEEGQIGRMARVTTNKYVLQQHRSSSLLSTSEPGGNTNSKSGSSGMAAQQMRSFRKLQSTLQAQQPSTPAVQYSPNVVALSNSPLYVLWQHLQEISGHLIHRGVEFRKMQQIFQEYDGIPRAFSTDGIDEETSLFVDPLEQFSINKENTEEAKEGSTRATSKHAAEVRQQEESFNVQSPLVPPRKVERNDASLTTDELKTQMEDVLWGISRWEKKSKKENSNNSPTLKSSFEELAKGNKSNERKLSAISSDSDCSSILDDTKTLWHVIQELAPPHYIEEDQKLDEMMVQLRLLTNASKGATTNELSTPETSSTKANSLTTSVNKPSVAARSPKHNNKQHKLPRKNSIAMKSTPTPNSSSNSSGGPLASRSIDERSPSIVIQESSVGNQPPEAGNNGDFESSQTFPPSPSAGGTQRTQVTFLAFEDTVSSSTSKNPAPDTSSRKRQMSSSEAQFFESFRRLSLQSGATQASESLFLDYVSQNNFLSELAGMQDPHKQSESTVAGAVEKGATVHLGGGLGRKKKPSSQAAANTFFSKIQALLQSVGHLLDEDTRELEAYHFQLHQQVDIPLSTKLKAQFEVLEDQEKHLAQLQSCAIQQQNKRENDLGKLLKENESLRHALRGYQEEQRILDKTVGAQENFYRERKKLVARQEVQLAFHFTSRGSGKQEADKIRVDEIFSPQAIKFDEQLGSVVETTSSNQKDNNHGGNNSCKKKHSEEQNGVRVEEEEFARLPIDFGPCLQKEENRPATMSNVGPKRNTSALEEWMAEKAKKQKAEEEIAKQQKLLENEDWFIAEMEEKKLWAQQKDEKLRKEGRVVLDVVPPPKPEVLGAQRTHSAFLSRQARYGQAAKRILHS